MKLCVLGLGYIGLPTAILFALNGLNVHGVDINPTVINALNGNRLPIKEPGLQELLFEAIERNTITFSTVPVESDIYIIAVPTPINEHKAAELKYVRSAAEMIVPLLRKGNLVILESTVPPLTVQDVLIPILKRSSLEIGHDLFVAFSPERVIPGRLLEEFVRNDRIIGGINEGSTRRAVSLYKAFVKGNIHETDAVTAEMVKLMENTYRDINIALANELARVAEKVGFNVWEAIALANTHPRVMLHKPGPGVGGHCIAVDPWFIVEKAPEESRLISRARGINDETPHHMTRLIQQALLPISEPTVTLLGLAFKGNIEDTRESPSLEIVHGIRRLGYKLKIYDPLVKLGLIEEVDSLAEAVIDSDCMVILTDHDAFKDIDFASIKPFMRHANVLDTRRIVDPAAAKNHGFRYMLIGTPFLRGDGS